MENYEEMTKKEFNLCLLEFYVLIDQVDEKETDIPAYADSLKRSPSIPMIPKLLH